MNDVLLNYDWLDLLKIIGYCLFIGVGVYLGRYVKSALKWIKEGIENGDGKLQNKELQIATFTFFFGFMIVGTTFFDKAYPMEMVLGALAGAGIMYGVNAMSKKHPEK